MNDEILCKIRDVYRAIGEFEVEFMQKYDLSLNEGMLLCTLLEVPKLTSGEIAEALGLSASNTSKVLRVLEKKKLITRLVGKEDKRQMRFFLTIEGQNRIAEIKNATFCMPDLLQQVISLVK
ncbi:MarR family protein [Bacteroides zoogleoformans]|uniref:MarR family transcriptional regulator n=1 Tax=Bacteroides zoogleoformans TaxID=28119 RepID=A0ABN5IME9_9BACE|nr:MarR family transcriptional regulator [Bacteroides zoogleoformans]AVM53794.1 MarR family transcriptional regulator [Bacteroides zoogleoformans]TWJ18214.1 MarR family protein [Bacteroides zoogleoformans]